MKLMKMLKINNFYKVCIKEKVKIRRIGMKATQVFFIIRSSFVCGVFTNPFWYCKTARSKVIPGASSPGPLLGLFYGSLGGSQDPLPQTGIGKCV